MEKGYNYKTLTFEEMKEYIEKNAPQDKAWFKGVAFGNRVIKDNDGNAKKTINVYSHLKAKKAFCERYMPEIVPVAKEKTSVTKILEDW